MAIRVRDRGRDFVPPPSGLQQAVCCDVVELGLVDTAFGRKRKVALVFQSEHLMESGKPFLITQRYGATLHPKGTLRPVLEGWRGKALSDKEAEDFDLEVLIGKNCQLLIVHNTKDGQTYGNIQSIVPAAKGSKPLAVRDYIRKQDRPDYKPPVTDEPEPDEPGSSDGETQVDVGEDEVPF